MKKLIAVLLSLCLIAAMVPMAALADEAAPETEAASSSWYNRDNWTYDEAMNAWYHDGINYPAWEWDEEYPGYGWHGGYDDWFTDHDASWEDWWESRYHVASIDGTFYPTLGDALNAAKSGDTIYIHKDVRGDFALNGVSLVGWKGASVSGDITTKGNVTLQDLTVYGDITVAEGTTEAKNVSVRTSGYDVVVKSDASFEMDGYCGIDYIWAHKNATVETNLHKVELSDGNVIYTDDVSEYYVAYAGGNYSARMIIAGPTLTTSATQAGADDTVTSLFGNQGYTIDGFIEVTSRSVNDKNVTETVTVNGGKADSTNGRLPKANGTATGNGSKYINPYEFELADFQAATTADSVEVKFAGDEQPVVYTTTDPNYKLAWDFSTMAVDYLGGRVALTARLTGPDGSTQAYEIPYYVQRMLVANMTSYKGVNNPTVNEKDGTVTGGDNYFTSSFGVDVNDTKALGVAETSFKINPFNPLSQSLPTGYHVTFNVYNPNLNENGEFTGEFTGAPSITVDYSYLKFTMPSSAKITAEKAQKTDNAG